MKLLLFASLTVAIANCFAERPIGNKNFTEVNRKLPIVLRVGRLLPNVEEANANIFEWANQNLPNITEDTRNFPNLTENRRKLPNASGEIRTLPNVTEDSRKLPNTSGDSRRLLNSREANVTEGTVVVSNGNQQTNLSGYMANLTKSETGESLRSLSTSDIQMVKELLTLYRQHPSLAFSTVQLNESSSKINETGLNSAPIVKGIFLKPPSQSESSRQSESTNERESINAPVRHFDLSLTPPSQIYSSWRTNTSVKQRLESKLQALFDHDDDAFGSEGSVVHLDHSVQQQLDRFLDRLQRVFHNQTNTNGTKINCITPDSVLKEVGHYSDGLSLNPANIDVDELARVIYTHLTNGDCIDMNHDIFVDYLFFRYAGNSDSDLNSTGLMRMATDLGIQILDDNDSSNLVTLEHSHHRVARHSHFHDHDHATDIDESERSGAGTKNLMHVIDFYQLYDSDDNRLFDQDEFRRLSPALIYLKLNGDDLDNAVLYHRGVTDSFEHLHDPKLEEQDRSERPTPMEIYGYGTLAVFIISASSLLGVVLFPLLSTELYRYLLMGFIAMAFGTLTGDALLHLIPESLSVHDHHHDHGQEHDHDDEGSFCGMPTSFWTMLLVSATIYVLYLFEITSELLVSNRHSHGKSHEHSHIPDLALVKAVKCDSFDIKHDQNPNVQTTMERANHGKVYSSDSDLDLQMPKSVDNLVGDDIFADEISPTVCFGLSTLAMVIIIGDGIHNIGDGMTIGAAFSRSTRDGLSTALAIFCHEIPHEFGDFVILLSTGMSFRRALLWNFICALTAFIGLYIGIVLGENEGAQKWIFTVAAGMFLYVAIGDMLPELKRHRGRSIFKTLLAQNLGILSGFAFMILIAVYEDQIKI